jgi:hypothetical protein
MDDTTSCDSTISLTVAVLLRRRIYVGVRPTVWPTRLASPPLAGELFPSSPDIANETVYSAADHVDVARQQVVLG